MFKTSLFLVFLIFSVLFAGFLRHQAYGACSGNCNAVDPNNPSIASNGERIFLTGMSKEGDEMSMVNFRLALPDDFFGGGAEHKKKVESAAMPCFRCHNFYGTGGTAFEYEGRTVKSANLVNIGEMKFTLEELKKALSEGVGMDKRNLVPFMPRFNLTDQQLKDIQDFILQLPGRLNALKAEQEGQGKNRSF